MGGLDVETFGEILFDGEPLVFVVNFTAPGADAQKTLQVEEAGEHFFGGTVDEAPNQAGQHVFHERFAPVELGGAGEDVAGQIQEFIGPGEQEEGEEAGMDITKDGLGLLLTDHKGTGVSLPGGPGERRGRCLVSTADTGAW